MTVASDRGTFLEYITACSLIHPFHPAWSISVLLVSEFNFTINCPIELSKNVSRSSRVAYYVRILALSEIKFRCPTERVLAGLILLNWTQVLESPILKMWNWLTFDQITSAVLHLWSLRIFQILSKENEFRIPQVWHDSTWISAVHA